MAILPLQLARVSNTLRANVATGTLSRTQRSLLEVQNQLITQRRLNTASDDPGDAAIVQQLRKTLEQRDAYRTNIQQASGHLAEVDSTLADITSLVQDAKNLASANVGAGISQSQRDGAAEVLKSIHGQVLSLANKQFQGSYLFGDGATTGAPFIESGGGIKFVGSTRVLVNRFDESTILPFTVSADETFGALSNRVKGTADLSPSLAPATLLTEMKGAAGTGIARGSIELSDGTTTRLVDLAGADDLGDVITAINAAAVPGVTAAIAPDGNSLLLSAAPAANITVREVGGGTTATDLGIVRPTGGGAGVSLDGQNLRPRLSGLTPLASLRGGAGFDQTSGLTITNGLLSKTITFGSATTVEDLLNAINGAGVGVRAEINAEGTGINILNPTSGTEMRIAENGGSTAAHLGVRSYSPATQLTELNAGRGVRTVAGADLRITNSAGTGFDVDLTSATTIQDVLTAINTAATGAGASVTATFAASGNGIVLTDTAGGAGTLTLTAANFSTAAADLGLTTPAAGNVITGADVNPAVAAGVFDHLGKLRDALLRGDTAAITAAAEGLEQDHARLIRVRGIAGARLQEMEARGDRMEAQNLATKTLLSELEDVDFTEAVARYQTLQTSLQAAMQTSGRTLSLSLLDFLG